MIEPKMASRIVWTFNGWTRIGAMNPCFELEGIASSMPSSIPPCNAPSRLGGDEDGIALPATDSHVKAAAGSAPRTAWEMTEHFPPAELGIAPSKPTLIRGRRLGSRIRTNEAVPSKATGSWRGETSNIWTRIGAMNQRVGVGDEVTSLTFPAAQKEIRDSSPRLLPGSWVGCCRL
jgi:hypothetical protein